MFDALVLSGAHLQLKPRWIGTSLATHALAGALVPKAPPPPLKDIPNPIPPVDLTQRPLDPRDFTGRGEEGGLATGVAGGTGKADVWSGTPASGAIYEATMDDERFAPAVVISQPAPLYPTQDFERRLGA